MVFQELSWGVNLEHENDIYNREWVPEIFAPGVWDRSGACLYFDEEDNEKDVPAWSSPGFRAASALFAAYSAPTQVGAQRQLHVLSTANSSEEVRCHRAMLPAASFSFTEDTFFGKENLVPFLMRL